MGVVVPMVNSRAECEEAVQHTRYHPIGNRSVGGQLHAPNFGTDPATYYEKANDEILLVVMVEHVKGVENLDAILSVPGIDAVFIGPNDLHKSMGQKPSFDIVDANTGEVVFPAGTKISPRLANKAGKDGLTDLLIPTEEYADEFKAVRRYLPERWTTTVDVRKPCDPAAFGAELDELRRRRVLVDVPDPYC